MADDMSLRDTVDTAEESASGGTASTIPQAELNDITDRLIAAFKTVFDLNWVNIFTRPDDHISCSRINIKHSINDFANIAHSEPTVWLYCFSSCSLISPVAQH